MTKFWIRPEIQNMKMWVLTVNDVIEGMIAIRPINVKTVEKPDSDWLPSQTDGTLAHLIVSRDFRGRGFAKKLLKQSLDFAKEHGFERLHLDTTSTQHEALNMYLKKGWRVVRRTPVLCGQFELLACVKDL